MYNKLSLSLLLASCTLLPGCGCGTKEAKSTVATDVTDNASMVHEAAVTADATTAAHAAPMATKNEGTAVQELATSGNALAGGKVYDYKELVTRSGDLNSILSNNAHVVVDFFAVWCGPCKALAPQLDKLAESNKDVVFIKVDVDKDASVSGSHGVRAMPTTVYFKNGKEINRITGADISKVKDAINKLRA